MNYRRTQLQLLWSYIPYGLVVEDSSGQRWRVIAADVTTQMLTVIPAVALATSPGTNKSLLLQHVTVQIEAVQPCLRRIEQLKESVVFNFGPERKNFVPALEIARLALDRHDYSSLYMKGQESNKVTVYSTSGHSVVVDQHWNVFVRDLEGMSVNFVYQLRIRDLLFAGQFACQHLEGSYVLL